MTSPGKDIRASAACEVEAGVLLDFSYAETNKYTSKEETCVEAESTLWSRSQAIDFYFYPVILINCTSSILRKHSVRNTAMQEGTLGRPHPLIVRNTQLGPEH